MAEERTVVQKTMSPFIPLLIIGALISGVAYIRDNVEQGEKGAGFVMSVINFFCFSLPNKIYDYTTESVSIVVTALLVGFAMKTAADGKQEETILKWLILYPAVYTIGCILVKMAMN